MPQIRIVNDTQVPLHIALTQVGPLHWQNNVEPGQTAVLKPGPVFFTIQARIARGVNNEYDNLQRFLPIAVVSVSVVTLGVGAVYFAGAYAAAGSASAVAANISAQLATKAPTVRKLYRYARKYQTVARIGNMIGIGGSMLAGTKVVAAEQQQAEEQQETQSSLFGGFMRKKTKKEEKKQTKESMKILQGLVAGSVVSSPGWYLNRDRTLRIVGGPRATQVDDLLIIETDTLEPFRIIEEDGKTLAKGQSQQEIIEAGQQAQLRAAAGAAAAAAENQDPTHTDAHIPLTVDENSQLRRTKSTPDHAALAAAADVAALHSDSDSDSEDEHQANGARSPPGYSAAVKGKLVEWGASINGMTEEALQRGASMYSRFRSPKASGTTTPNSASVEQASKTPASGAQLSPAKEKQGILDYTSVAEKVKTDTKEGKKESSASPDDGGLKEEGEVSPLTALLEMGFSPIEANTALRNHSGDLKASIEELLRKDGEALTKLAASTPLPSSPPAVAEGSEGVLPSSANTVTTSVGTVPDSVSLAAKIPAGMAYSRPAAPASPQPQTPSKPPLKVVGGEELETPHWTQKAQQTYTAATSTELGKFAQQQVIDRGLAFATGDIAGATGFGARKTASAMRTSTQKKQQQQLEAGTKKHEGYMSFLKRSKSEAVPSSGKKRT
ncbi:hypothetical protein OC846_000267 [Tilletia horrida]|uniref:UBA domain-containing protein n=1 Tax=Tilletia horrida TaxID=155126 RepID=A0AAN6GVF9_9BASI|nr:hypothetical protein OC846_000267 [Tilletia horrida]KAK0570326.1 hypothetical protein OC861_000069 [Tilletia horrida]